MCIIRTIVSAALAVPLTLSAATSTVVGWNNLGMHCMDSDYSVFSILPPYNTIEAQLIVNGKLVTNGAGYSISYQAVADPDGSFNSTAIGKGNFYTFTPWLYGPLAPDMGLAGWGMPGTNNVPQAMLFEETNHPAAGVATPVNWFRAEGIPISPFDDAMHKNTYPLMRLLARDATSRIIATNDIVLPVSDEMDCRACHASGAPPAARPWEGWVYDPNPERDFRLNILRLHDEAQFANQPALYSAALKARGFNASGLYTNVVVDGRPVLCASCHSSEALGTASYGAIPALTTSMHSMHAQVMDPVSNLVLDSSVNRSACYQCHPGSTTKCLRGAMGSAVAPDGSMEMQCQSCHGSMSQVGSTNRIGWFMEPNCQSCHTGTATRNSGQIRYTSVFDSTGAVRVPADSTFATSVDTPAPGLSLFRFSAGHGGLQCEACHGSTHAEFPSAHRNDNVRNIELQGHAGVMAECTSCHTNSPNTINGGPHGMHPVGQTWVSQHPDRVGSVGAAACQACHGTDYRGTVLSRMQADRTLSAFGTKALFRGAIIGCYTCHNGPGNDSGNSSVPPTVSSVTASTRQGQAVAITLPVTGAGATLRIISQPASGTVGLNNNIATYHPDPTFAGTDTFTFAAYDGSKNSSLATGTVTVLGSVALQITAQPLSQTVLAGSSVSFSVTATGTAPLTYQWKQNGVNISGATSATLTLSSVTTNNAGSYTVVVANSAGSVTSAAAVLTVNVPAVAPQITAQPVSQTVVAGANVTVSVGASGTAPLTYQWQKNGVNIAGATSASLVLSSVTTNNAGSYTVIVANSAGSVTSAAAVLTVNLPAIAPQITAQPVSQTVLVGANVTFSVGASGTAPLAYQWQKNGVNIAGATSASLVLSSVTTNNAGSYTVFVGNSAGSVTSAAAVLTVNLPAIAPQITAQPVSQTVLAGANVTFSVSASGTAPLTYQWQKDGVNHAGATGASLVLSSVTTNNAGSYTVVVGNSAGSVTSAAAVLTVNVPVVAPQITAQPISQTVVAGANVTFSVGASGTAPLSYQWRKNGVSISGATSPSLTLSAVTTNNAGTYSVRVSNTAGSAVSSNAVLTVTPVPLSVQLTSPTNGAVYTAPATIYLAVKVTGSVTKVQYYNGTQLLGTVSSSPFAMTGRNIRAGTYNFKAKAFDASGKSVTSAPVTVTVRQSSTYTALKR